MKIDQPFFELAPTAFGTMGIVWWRATAGSMVRQMYLSRGQTPTEKIIREKFPLAQSLSSPAIVGLAGQLRRFLEGKAEIFNLDMMALEACGEFQRRVLLAEYGIPRGWVSTYGRIAKHIGVVGGDRAVGRALAENPFPLVIPCHRAVRADGDIGGYQGGGEMKRALLAMEGVKFTDKGRVLMEKVYY
jgi:methylated-DNA-[protein]-cysteine S-methyltransferase